MKILIGNQFSINKLRDRKVLSLRRTGELSNLRKKIIRPWGK